MTIRRRLSALGVVVALSLASLLGGCAATAAGPGYRDRVEQIARQASGGDISGALGALDLLAADVSTSAGTGELTASEADRIAAAIDAVRLDLLALAPAPAAVPSLAPSGTGGLEGDSTDQGKNGDGSGKGKGRPDD